MTPKQFYEALAEAYTTGARSIDEVVQESGRKLTRAAIDGTAKVLRSAGNTEAAEALARSFMSKTGKVADKAAAAFAEGAATTPSRTAPLLSRNPTPAPPKVDTGPLPEIPEGFVNEPTVASNVPEVGDGVTIEGSKPPRKNAKNRNKGLQNTVANEEFTPSLEPDAPSTDRVEGMRTEGETKRNPFLDGPDPNYEVQQELNFSGDPEANPLTFESTGDPEIDEFLANAERDGGFYNFEGEWVSNDEIARQVEAQKPIIFDNAKKRGLIDEDGNVTTPEQRAAFADENQFRKPEPPPPPPPPPKPQYDFDQLQRIGDTGTIGIDEVGPTENILDARITDAPGMRIDPRSEFTPYIDPRSVDMKRLRDLGLGEFSADISVPGSSMDQAMQFGFDPRLRPLDLSGFDPMSRPQPFTLDVAPDAAQSLTDDIARMSQEGASEAIPNPVLGPPASLAPTTPSHIGEFSSFSNPVQGPPVPPGFDGRPFVGPPPPPPPPPTSRRVPTSGLEEFGPPLANEGQNFSRYTSNPVQGPPLPPGYKDPRPQYGPFFPPKGPMRDKFVEGLADVRKAKEAAGGNTNTPNVKPPQGNSNLYRNLLYGGVGGPVALGAGYAAYNTLDSVQDFYDTVEREQQSAQSIDDMYREIENAGRERTPMLNAGQPKPNPMQGQAEDMFRQRMGVEDPKQDDVLADPPKSMKKRNLKDTT